jgi:hypothetical protein
VTVTVIVPVTVVGCVVLSLLCIIFFISLFSGGVGDVKLTAALSLVRAFQTLGHLTARTCPIGLEGPPRPAELDIASYGLSREDVVTLPENSLIGGCSTPFTRLFFF